MQYNSVQWERDRETTREMESAMYGCLGAALRGPPSSVHYRGSELETYMALREYIYIHPLSLYREDIMFNEGLNARDSSNVGCDSDMHMSVSLQFDSVYHIYTL